MVMLTHSMHDYFSQYLEKNAETLRVYICA